MGRLMRHLRAELEQNGLGESLWETFRKGMDEILGIKNLKEEVETLHYFLNLTQSACDLPAARGGVENYSYVMFS